jgi:hypothetical protein
VRLAASFDSRPATHAAGRSVGDILNASVEVNQDAWAESFWRDQADQVRVGSVPVAGLPGAAWLDAITIAAAPETVAVITTR